VKPRVALLGSLCLLAAVGSAGAIELSIGTPWIRSAVAGQADTPAYMDINSDTAVKLVGAISPWAEKIEIIAVEAKDGAVVERTLPMLDVVPGQTRLAPGGSHLALKGIKQAFGNGDFVPITLRFEDASRTPHTVAVSAQARGMTAPTPRVQP
jgi:periplasmic copper chaperone A